MFSVRWLNLLDDCDVRIPYKAVGSSAFNVSHENKHRDEFKSRRIRANLATAMSVHAAGKLIKKDHCERNLHFKSLAQRFSTSITHHKLTDKNKWI
jgi:hypothetical protein